MEIPSTKIEKMGYSGATSRQPPERCFIGGCEIRLPDEVPIASAARYGFATTLWSVVLSARDTQPLESEAALEALCKSYWFPLYAFLRRQGHEPADAQDLVQGFFARLLEKNYLRSVTPEKGRFRHFLLAALRHYVADERDRAQAQKRGGRTLHLSLQSDEAELIYSGELTDQESPEKLYERRWAMALLEQAQARLREECARAGKSVLYEAIGPSQTQDARSESYAEIGVRLGLSESALKSASVRLRRRYQELIREEVAQTMVDPKELEEELRHLLRVLSE